MRAGILLRLSEEKDTEEKTQNAFERFEHACRRLCEQREWTVVEVFNEGIVSAYKANRKRDKFELAMQALESKRVDVIVVPYVDRFARGYAEPARAEAAMRKSGGDIVDSTGRSATNDETWHVLVGVGIAESKRISRRVKAQRRQAAMNGKKNQGGRRLYGYDKDRTAIEPEEAAFIVEAAKRIIRGDSVRSVTAWMNASGSRTTGENLWSQQTVRPLLRSPAITGRRTYHGEIYPKPEEPPAWDPILDWETWTALQAVFEARRRGPKALGRSGKYLLSGMCVCGHCDTTLDAHHAPKARGGRRQYLCNRNPGRRGCGRIMASAEPLEALVSEQVLQALIDPRLQEALLQRPSVDPKVVADKNAAEAKLIELGEMYAGGEIGRSEYARMRESVLARIETAQTLLAQQAGSEVLTDLPRTEAKLREFWAGAELEHQRAILKAVMTKVIVGPSSRSNGPRFDDKRIAPPWGIQWRI